MTTRIVLDTDIGSDIDDTWALVQALRASALEIDVVTTVSGDPLYRARAAAAVLAAAGRPDTPVATGIGGNGRLEQPQTRLAASWTGDDSSFGSAVDAIVAACATPGAVIVAIGPLTNIAGALARDPSIAGRARVVAMCGSVHVGHRGAVGAVAEYNASTDVAATRAVLSAGWDVLLTPLDTCGTVVLRGDAYQRVRAAADAGDAVLRVLFDTYAEWLDAIGRPELLARRSSTLYDTVAVHLAHDESLWEIEPVPLSISDDGLMRVDPACGSTVRAALRWRAGGMDAFVDALVTTLLSS